jgi:hypothetical protein
MGATNKGLHGSFFPLSFVSGQWQVIGGEASLESLVVKRLRVGGLVLTFASTQDVEPLHKMFFCIYYTIYIYTGRCARQRARTHTKVSTQVYKTSAILNIRLETPRPTIDRDIGHKTALEAY